MSVFIVNWTDGLNDYISWEHSVTNLGHEARPQMSHSHNWATAMIYVVLSQEQISRNAMCRCCYWKVTELPITMTSFCLKSLLSNWK
jgi:hypothetical protein